MPLLAAALVAVAVAGLVSWAQPAPRPDLRSAADAVRAFFAGYVEPGGRVVRHDQGGDTVSEGQAYAMLLAVAAGDRPRFDAVWAWTRAHLQRSDGLLAWHWAHGVVADANPASDADLDAAWALDLAARHFGEPADARAAARMGAAILAEETAPAGVDLVLVAGPWARSDPAVVDLSYASPLAFTDLSRLTGDPRWGRLAAGSAAVTAALTSDPDRLPPDWATVTPGGTADASPSPRGAGPAYGLDAARLVVWDAASCQAALVDRSATAWTLLRPTAARRLFPLSLSLRGGVRRPGAQPLVAVADAAAAAAAGHRREAGALMAAASRAAQRRRTYYGTAWVALGRVLLGTQALGSCKII